MRFFLLSALALAAAATTASMTVSEAHANELDNEALVTNEQVRLAQDLPATVIVRVNEATQAVEVLHSKENLSVDAASPAAIAEKTFSPVDLKAGLSGELDQDSSRSSWYFYFSGYSWYAPTYYYWGYNYNYSAYHSYSYGGYSYYWCRWNYGYWY